MVGIEKEDASVYWLGRRNYSSTVVLHGARLLTHAAIELAVSLPRYSTRGYAVQWKVRGGSPAPPLQFSGRFKAGAPKAH